MNFSDFRFMRIYPIIGQICTFCNKSVKFSQDHYHSDRSEVQGSPFRVTLWNRESTYLRKRTNSGFVSESNPSISYHNFPNDQCLASPQAIELASYLPGQLPCLAVRRTQTGLTSNLGGYNICSHRSILIPSPFRTHESTV